MTHAALNLDVGSAQAESTAFGLFLTTQEAAQFTRISASTLTKLRLTGEGPPFIKRGKTVVYHRPDLVTYLTGLRRRSTSDVA